MNFEPIEIKISDIELFGEVALTIDNQDFIASTNRIRKKYGIKKPFRNNDYHSWIISDIIKKKGEDEAKRLFNDIDFARKDLILTDNYFNVIEKAVFGADIFDSDYESTPLVNLRKIPPYYTQGPTEEGLSAVVLTPQTEEKDVMALYRKHREKLERYRKVEKQDEIYLFERIRIIRNPIKISRELYWLSKQGGKINEIINRWYGLCPFGGKHENDKNDKTGEKCKYCSATLDEDLTRKAIKNYHKACNESRWWHEPLFRKKE